MSEQLHNLFAEVLGVPVETVSEQTSPTNTPRWDSLATINLTLSIESEFGVKLSTREIIRMASVGKAREVLRNKGVLTV
jgi:acyl carrier protein